MLTIALARVAFKAIRLSVIFPKGLDDFNKIKDRTEKNSIYGVLIGLCFWRFLIINCRDKAAIKDFRLLRAQFRVRHKYEFQIIWQWFREILKDEPVREMRDRIKNTLIESKGTEVGPLDSSLLLI